LKFVISSLKSGYKYTVYSDGELKEQLFDMKADPGEMNNLATKENYDEVLKKH